MQTSANPALRSRFQFYNGFITLPHSVVSQCYVSHNETKGNKMIIEIKRQIADLNLILLHMIEMDAPGADIKEIRDAINQCYLDIMSICRGTY